MLLKTIQAAFRLNYSTSTRLYSSKESYLHNPGTEPLLTANLGDVLMNTANRHPGRTALTSVYENTSLTYEELLTKADRLGCALRAQGLEKGDRVGVWSHNNAAWMITLVATVRAGLIPVAINPVYEKSELSFCINKTGIKSLIIGEPLPNRKYYDVLRSLVKELPESKPGALKSDVLPSLTSVIAYGKENIPGTFSFDSLIAENNGNDASKYNAEIKSSNGAFIHLTSGTTGDPKAALNSHCGVVNNTYFTGKRLTFHEEHHTVCLQAPMFHVLGSFITTLGTLQHGGTIVIPSPTYNVTANLNALLSEQCTAITGTPTMHVDMLRAISNKGEVPSKLKIALAAGAPCSPTLINNIKAHLKAQKVLTLYGLTESTASIYQSLPEDDINKVAETVGYLLDHVEVKVVDQDGKTVPFGSPGELLSRGYNNMICYWDEPGKTRNTIDEDGWLHTGDKFTISEDGYGRIVGRLKDIIVRGGENIAPKEIEDLLNTHPDIIESQVIGVTDERLGEELCAVLRTKDGATITSKDIANHCSGKLARFKIPRLLKFTSAFPKTASGKIQKHKIVEMVESGKLL